MKFKKTLSLLLCTALCLSSLSGCGSAEKKSETDSETAAVSKQSEEASETEAEAADDSGKTSIVVGCQHSHIRTEFEQAVEDTFDDIDVVLSADTSLNARFRLQQLLTHDLAPDICIFESLPYIGDELLSEYFYDLSAESFVNHYYLSTINSCTSPDSGLYYLPGPSHIYGIVYDKTAFQELGLSVPKNYTEFKELCQEVKDRKLMGYEPDPEDSEKQVETPVEPFVPTIMWPDMFQILFNTINYESSIRGVSNAKWLSDYQAGKGSLKGHMEGASEKYLKMFDDGILSLDFWETKPFYRTKKLYDYHTALMTIECQQALSFNEDYGNPENLHEMGLMPIFTSDEPDTEYLYGIPRCYIGITKKAASDPEKLSAMMKILDYLSTSEGQKELIGGSEYFGFLKSAPSFEDSFYDEVRDTIDGGRVITTFFLGGRTSGGSVEASLHEQTPALVNGDITVEQWLTAADEARDSLFEPQKEEVYGTVEETLLPIQAAYVEGQTLLHSMDADIGFIQVAPNYGTLQYMFSGDITEEAMDFYSPQVSNVAQPIEGDMDFVVVEMTGKEIMDCITGNKDPQASATAALAGVEMEVDLTKTGTDKYVSLNIDGKEMDMEQTYRVATVRGSVPDYTPVQELKEVSFADLFKTYLQEAADGVIAPPEQLEITE